MSLRISRKLMVDKTVVTRKRVIWPGSGVSTSHYPIHGTCRLLFWVCFSWLEVRETGGLHQVTARVIILLALSPKPEQLDNRVTLKQNSRKTELEVKTPHIGILQELVPVS
jgi:hypothetical protein